MFILVNGTAIMLTKNNWYTSNLHDRFRDKSASFSAFMQPYSFDNISFAEACQLTLNEITHKHDNFYLALSGGLDSSFILKQFIINGVSIVPIIVDCCNQNEIDYAFELCDSLNVSPIVIKKTEDEMFDYYVKYIHEPFAGVGYNATHVMVAAEYTIRNYGTLITGNHLMGDGEETSDDYYASANEWDFYTDHILKECNNIDFLLYTPEIAYAAMPKQAVTWKTYKSQLFDLVDRPKIKPSFSEEMIASFQRCIRSVPYRKSTIAWTREEFVNIFEKSIK